MKNKLIPLVLTLGAALSGTGLAFDAVVENFNGTSLNGFRWFTYQPTKGRLFPENGKLNFVVKGTPTIDDFASIELLTVNPGTSENWEMTVKFSNTEKISKQAGCGFMIFNTQNRRDYFFTNFFSSYGVSSGFFTDLNYTPAEPMSLASVEPIGAVRVSYDSATGLMTFSAYRKNSSGGFKWNVMGTFAPFGAPGGDVSTNWTTFQSAEPGPFGIQLFGSAVSSKVATGKVTIDSFNLKPLH